MARTNRIIPATAVIAATAATSVRSASGLRLESGSVLAPVSLRPLGMRGVYDSNLTMQGASAGSDVPEHDLGGREIALAAILACGLSLVMNGVLIPGFSDAIPGRLGDPLLQAWEIAWGGHALLHQPLHYFDTNAFWPISNSLAFSDALIGYAPAGLVGDGTTAALVRYNLLFVLSYVVAFLGAYLLARELKLPPTSALIAGTAFAFSLWRLSQYHHLNILSSGGIPLCLFMLARGYRRRSPGMILGGWAVAMWQVSLGFSLGLPLLYLLGLLGAISAIAWLRRGRPAIAPGVQAVTLAGVVLFVSWTALLASPYLQAARDHPQARRSLAEVDFFSPPKKGVFAAPEESLLYGAITEPIRRRLPWPEEQTLFPGVVVPSLALAGLLWGPLSRRVRAGLAAGVAGTFALALGFRLWGPWSPYRFLYEFAPGWQGIRTPGRLMTLTTLGLALLAATGSWAIMSSLQRRMTLARWMRLTIPALLVGAVLLDGSGRISTPEVPPPPPGLSTLPEPQLHLPIQNAPLYMYWSTEGFPRIVNGYSGSFPRLTSDVARETAGFPDARSAELLRSLGVRTVVLHLRLIEGTAWADAPQKPLTGVPVPVRRAGDLLIYRLND